MEQHLIFVAPYIAIAAVAVLSAFGTDNWPDWLADLCVFNAILVNGVWASGVLVVVLTIIGIPFGVAALIGLPVAYLVGRMIVGKE